MKTFVTLVAFSVTAFAASVHGTCDKKYSDITPGHTMCLTDNSAVKKQGVSAADQAQILRIHNDKRATTSPSATDLTKLIWSEELAKVAQKWSAQCQVEHDKYIQRRVPGLDGAIGQNAAGGYPTWAEAINGWHSEVKDFTYGSKSNVGEKVGHYTQMVNKNAQMVGCGYAECSTGMNHIYICNYAVGQSDLNTPYNSGARCSACPNHCKDGLCDCGGLLCQNGGKLNLKSCTCDCVSVFKGKDCSRAECPPSDKSFCGKPQPYGYPASFCSVAANVPLECPIMCGKCKPGKPGSGGSGSVAKCSGPDPSHCGPKQPYGYPQSLCGQYDNVPKECPKMCGKCQ